MYRIWDKVSKKWIKDGIAVMPDGNIVTYKTDKSKSIFAQIKNIFDDTLISLISPSSVRYFVTSDTYMFDKNNLPIYEGDIVEFEVITSDEKIEVKQGVIVYVKEYVSYVILDYDEVKYYTLSQSLQDRISVIGNVFENQDIIKMAPEIIKEL